MASREAGARLARALTPSPSPTPTSTPTPTLTPTPTPTLTLSLTRYDVTMARPDAFLRAAANFSGSRPVTMLGARRRRPSKKLEIELRELGGGAGGGGVVGDVGGPPAIGRRSL